MNTREKKVVTRPIRSGGLSTYIQSYDSSSKKLSPALEFINSLKNRNNVLNRYNLEEFFNDIPSVVTLSTYDVFFIKSKIKSIIDIELIVKFLSDNILEVDLSIACSIINNIPVKLEYYEMLIKEIISNKKIEKQYLIPLLYSLNNHDMMISVLNKMNKYEKDIINPLNIIDFYNKKINTDCFSAMINAFYNLDKSLKYLTNGIKLSTIENKLLSSIIKTNNKIILKDVDELYSYLFINMNAEIAAHIYKNNININIDYNFDNFFEFERNKKNISATYEKIKKVNIDNVSDFLINDSGFYLSNDNECYLIIELKLEPPKIYNFDFIFIPNQIVNNKYLICNR